MTKSMILAWSVFCVLRLCPTARASCPNEGQVLTSPSGVISSNQAWQTTYDNNNRCKWVILVEGAYALDLEMKTFNIPDQNDYLQIDSCFSIGSVQSVGDCDASGDRLSGHSVPWQFEEYVVNSVVQQTTVPFVFYFHSNGADVGEGFEVAYSVRSCPGSGKTISAPRGSITDGPGSYGRFAYCKWRIHLEDQGLLNVQFQFSQLDTAAGDTVKIEECAPCPQHRYCFDGYECTELWSDAGNVIPPALYSSATMFDVTFSARTVSTWATFEGFTLEYGAQCASGFFSSSSGCKPCSAASCPLGKFRTSCPVGALQDSTCQDCSQSELPPEAEFTSECEWTCRTGHFQQGAVCVECQTCSTNETEVAQCTSSSDRQCGSCSTCADDEFEVQLCTKSSDTRCAECTTCSPAQFETAGCLASADRECADCTVCSSTQFESAPCSAFGDRQCSDCKQCEPLHFEVTPCSSTSDRQCQECTLCNDDEFELTACSAVSDTECRRCSTCSSVEFEFEPCSASRDRRCAACDFGECPFGERLLGCGKRSPGACAVARESMFAALIEMETPAAFTSDEEASFSSAVARATGVLHADILVHAALAKAGDGAFRRRQFLSTTTVVVNTTLFTSDTESVRSVDGASIKRELEVQGFNVVSVTGVQHCSNCNSEEYEKSQCSVLQDRMCKSCDAGTVCGPGTELVGCGSGRVGQCHDGSAPKTDADRAATQDGSNTPLALIVGIACGGGALVVAACFASRWSRSRSHAGITEQEPDAEEADNVGEEYCPQPAYRTAAPHAV